MGCAWGFFGCQATVGQVGGLGAGEHPRLGALGWDGAQVGWDADGIGWGWAGSPSLLLLSTVCGGEEGLGQE